MTLLRALLLRYSKPVCSAPISAVGLTATNMDFDRGALRQALADLAGHGVYLGTSSWKYPGWCGTVYDEARYMWRGRFAKSRFEKGCLTEYGETFKTVSVDATYYALPTRKLVEGLAAQVPADFRFGFKVSDAITVKRKPNLPRFGELAGKPNPQFLDPAVFEDDFLGPLEAIRAQVGILMFEFSRFSAADFRHGRDFVAALDAFLAAVPTSWPYGIEVRNREWLVPEYFDCLARHGVAHVFNAWTKMPTVTEQLSLPGSRPNPVLVGARFLLAQGRFYENAISGFEPFDSLKEVNDEARAAALALLEEGEKTPGRRTYIFINNRLEGSAPWTIKAMIDARREASRRRLTTQVGAYP
jgi:uncharacterized protein YecE (DUF72 family)